MVYEGGLSPEYVLDKMRFYEIDPLIQDIYKKNKEKWEMARFIAYIMAQTQSTKEIQMTKLLSFPWEEKEREEEKIEITKEYRETLFNIAKKFKPNE